MATNSNIEWTEATWNPVTGCTKHSAGCQNCYAAAMARRLKAMGQVKYAEGFTVRCHETVLDEPMHWRKPRRVFVCSMSDLFHDDVPDDFIRRVFGVIEETPQHEYQILTKRAERLAELAPRLPWPSNLWAGVTVESDHYTHRIEALRTVPAAVRFLSIEPLLGPIPGLDLRDIDWVIVGGESGPGHRPVEADWIREIRYRCVACEVPFFFKQWGGPAKGKRGRELDGRTWDQYPVASARNAAERFEAVGLIRISVEDLDLMAECVSALLGKLREEGDVTATKSSAGGYKAAYDTVEEFRDRLYAEMIAKQHGAVLDEETYTRWRAAWLAERRQAES